MTWRGRGHTANAPTRHDSRLTTHDSPLPEAQARQRGGNLQNGSAAIRAAAALLLCTARLHTDTADENNSLTAGWRRRQPHRAAQSAPRVHLDLQPGVDEDVDSAWALPTTGLRCTDAVVARTDRRYRQPPPACRHT